MSYLGISALFNLPGEATAQPDCHDDLRAAYAALAAGPAARPGILWRLVPAGIRRAVERRRAERLREEGLARLAETSPHLLEDVGLAPPVTQPGDGTHNAHLARDIAIGPEEVTTVHTIVPARSRILGASVARGVSAK